MDDVLGSEPGLSHSLPVCSSTSVELSNAVQWENPACVGISSAVNTVLTCEIMLNNTDDVLYFVSLHSFDQKPQESVLSLSEDISIHVFFLYYVSFSILYTSTFLSLWKKMLKLFVDRNICSSRLFQHDLFLEWQQQLVPPSCFNGRIDKANQLRVVDSGLLQKPTSCKMLIYWQLVVLSLLYCDFLYADMWCCYSYSVIEHFHTTEQEQTRLKQTKKDI